MRIIIVSIHFILIFYFFSSGTLDGRRGNSHVASSVVRHFGEVNKTSSYNYSSRHEILSVNLATTYLKNSLVPLKDWKWTFLTQE